MLASSPACMVNHTAPRREKTFRIGAVGSCSSQRLVTIPGVGPVTALTLAVEIDPAMFESGRHLAAWAGLTPKERSTGGKQRMGGISRAGNERLRVLLVSGATAVINAAMKPGSRQMTDPRPERDAFIAATALAHSMTVVTRNVADFAPTGVPLLNPWDASQ